MRPLLFLFAIVSATASLTAQNNLEHRKADLTIRVQTESGSPLAGATIEVEMLNHAFRFGCAVEHHLIDPESNQYDAFTVEQLQRYFNSATYGNIMKWTYFEARTEEENLALAALPQNLNAFDGPDKLRLRGHVTVWGSSYQLPNRVENATDGTYISEQILEHVADYHTTFKDSGIDNFDLYNEHFNTGFSADEMLAVKIAGPELAAQAAEVAKWFNKAKEADPNAILFINDFNILNDWNAGDDRVVAYKAFIDAVRDAGGQIDGIGMQAHMDRPTTSKADILRRFDLLAAPMEPTENFPQGLPGLRLEITELDMSVRNRFFNNTWGWPDPNIAEEVALTEAILTAAFEHPSVDGITIWGLDDFSHWRGNAIMYDNLQDEESGTSRTRVDPVLKETGEIWIDYVTSEWWENHAGTSSSNGEYTANTFKGTHRVRVAFNGETREAIVNLEQDNFVAFNFLAEPNDAADYDTWSSLIDWGENDSSRMANPDDDNLNNFAEFVFGTNPLAADIESSPRLILNASEADLIEFSVRARSEGLSIQLLKSNNLVDWTPIEYLQSGIDIESGKARHTLRFGESDLEPSPQEGSVFYRVEFAE